MFHVIKIQDLMTNTTKWKRKEIKMKEILPVKNLITADDASSNKNLK